MNYKTTILPSGITLVTVYVKDSPSNTIFALSKSGSRDEESLISGIAHFIEHMMFKGTNSRPNSKIISEELDNLGANYNAFTNKEFTGYYIRSAKIHFDKALEILSDIYTNPIFADLEIDKEKGVIIEEMKMYNDLPQEKVIITLDELIYGEHVFGHNIVGNEKSINSFKHDDLFNFYNNHYVSQNTVIVVSGDIIHNDVLNKVQTLFSKLNNKNKPSNDPVNLEQDKPRIKIIDKKTDQIHIALAFHGLKASDNQISTMDILEGILDAGMSSRLFRKLREELGVAYYVGAGHDSFSDHGIFSIRAGIAQDKLYEVIEVLKRELETLKNDLVQDIELDRVKENMIGKIYLNSETSEQRAHFALIEQIYLNKIESLEDIENRWRKVNALDVRNMAEKTFDFNKLNICLMGQNISEEKIKAIIG